MSRVQYDTFLEMRKYFSANLEVLKDVIPMLIPVNQEDEQAFQLLINMLDDLNNRMKSATSLSDVSDFIDLDALECDWEEQRQQIEFMAERAKRTIEQSENYWEDDIKEAT